MSDITNEEFIDNIRDKQKKIIDHGGDVIAEYAHRPTTEGFLEMTKINTALLDIVTVLIAAHANLAKPEDPI